MAGRRLSLTSQLTGLLVAGLLATNLIAMLVNDKAYGDIPPLEKKQAIERLIVAYRLFEKCDRCDVDALLHGLNRGQARFSMSPENPLAGHAMNGREWTLAALIEGAADLPENSVTVFQDIDNDWPFTPLASEHCELTSVLQLGERWLVATQRTPILNKWWRPLLFSLPASVLPVLLLVILFTRRLLRPLGDLETAATRISRGQSFDPLALRGPREIRSLIEAFNSMQESLARHIRDKTYMLAAISHDLRTPITSLRLRAELLEDGEDKNGMIQTLAQLQGMVDEALAFLRDDAAQEAGRQVDVSGLLTEIAAQRCAMGQRVGFSGPREFFAVCYPLALSRAINNLLDNALFHGSRAEISLRALPRKLEIRIEDDGPGIPPEWQERVFEPFVRMDRQKGQGQRNVGLGLSIVRACIKRHGGTVFLKNGEDCGLAATIHLPFQPDAEPA